MLATSCFSSQIDQSRVPTSFENPSHMGQESITVNKNSWTEFTDAGFTAGRYSVNITFQNGTPPYSGNLLVENDGTMWLGLNGQSFGVHHLKKEIQRTLPYKGSTRYKVFDGRFLIDVSETYYAPSSLESGSYRSYRKLENRDLSNVRY